MQAKWVLDLTRLNWVQRRDLSRDSVPMLLGISVEIWYHQSISAKVRNTRAQTYLQSHQEMAWSSSSEAALLTKNVWLTLWNHTMFTSTSKPKWVLFHSNTRSSQPKKKNASMSQENSSGCCHSVYKVHLPIIVNGAAAGCFSWWHLALEKNFSCLESWLNFTTSHENIFRMFSSLSLLKSGQVRMTSVNLRFI